MSQSVYINAFDDFAFKYLFGRESHKDLLIYFLNGIFKGRKVIVDLEYNNVERRGPGKDYRRTVFDLYCTGDRGEKFIVEMQKSKPDNFKDRSIFYTSNLIQELGRSVEADWDYLLPEVFFIAIMDFRFEDTHPEHYFHDVRLMEINTGTEFYTKLNYIFIEMPKFKKTEAELETDQDRWLFMLNNLYKFREIPLSLSNKKEFIRLLTIAKVGNLNSNDMNAYERSLKIQRDNYSVRQAAVKEGLAEGKIEGRVEGKIEGKIEGRVEKAVEIALEMKQENLSLDLIMKLTKLSKEEIESL